MNLSAEIAPKSMNDRAGAAVAAHAQDGLNEAAVPSYPSCPEEYKEFIHNTSLEHLVYWKLSNFFEAVEGEIPRGILKFVMGHVERPLFALVLSKTVGNQCKASDILGVNRNTLHRKLKDHKIDSMEIRKHIKFKNRKSISDLVKHF